MEVSESVSETSGIDDLVSEQLGAEPSAPETPVEAAPTSGDSDLGSAPDPTPVSAEPPAIQAGAPVSPELTTQTAPQPTAQTVKIGDRDYTIQELQAAMTSAQQLPNLQRKYVELLEQAKQPPQGQAPQAQPQQAAPQMSHQDWMRAVRHKYDPLVEQGVKNGVIEKDFAALFPGMAAQMLAYRDGFMQQSQALQAIAADRQREYTQKQSTGLVNDVSRNLQMLAQSGEAFAPLKDPATAQGFFKYLYDLNPMSDQVRNPEFLARQWVAYRKDDYLQQAQAKAQAAARAEQTRYARADATTAARPAGLNQPVQKTPLDLMVEDHFDRSGL